MCILFNPVLFLRFSYGNSPYDRKYENTFSTLGRNNRVYHHQTSTPLQIPSALASSRHSVQEHPYEYTPAGNYYSR